MDLQADLNWINQELKTVKNATVLTAIKNILKYRTKENIESERISIEQYNKELDSSIAQIETGEYYTHQEMGDRIKQWGKQ